MITHTVSVCDEIDDIKELVPYLSNYLPGNDTILIVVDSKRVTDEVLEYVNSLDFQKVYYPLDINRINEQFQAVKLQCKSEYMHVVCADERPSRFVLENMRQIINGVSDAFAFPRINLYSDLTPETSEAMYIGSRPKNYLLTCPRNERGWICWPDYQFRLFKVTSTLRHGDGMHDGIVGFYRPMFLPEDEKYAIMHIKTVAHQSKVNKVYDGLL